MFVKFIGGGRSLFNLFLCDDKVIITMNALKLCFSKSEYANKWLIIMHLRCCFSLGSGLCCDVLFESLYWEKNIPIEILFQIETKLE